MQHFKNIGQLILETAEKHPDQLAIVSDQSMLNYRKFSQAVLSVASRLRAAGIGPGKIVAQSDDNLAEVAPVMIACAVLGASWVSLRVSQHLPKDLSPSLVLGDAPSRGDVAGIALDRSWFSADPLDPGTFPKIRPDDPLLYVATSGTTGAPKVIAITQQQQVLRAAATREDFIARQTVFATLFRANAYPYVTRFLSAFVNGATVVDSRSPELWVAAGVNHLYGSVAQMAEFFGTNGLPRKMPLVHVSGSRLSDGLARHLIENFDTVIDLYASTETNRSFKNQKSLGPDGQIVTTGLPLDSEVQIVDEDDGPVQEGTVGIVRVRNGYLVDGYLSNPEATKTSFRNGWFYTGDLGQIGKNGELIVIGRAGDVLNLGGVKINAAEVDDHLRALPAVADAMCFDVPSDDGPNELLAFVVPRPGVEMSDIAAQCEQLVAPVIGKARMPRRLIQIAEVPRAHDGGAKRFLCRQIYLGGRKVG